MPSQIGRVHQDKERCLLFRGWSRLRLHAASLNVAERTYATATAAARATGVHGEEGEPAVAADDAETLKHARTEATATTMPDELPLSGAAGVSAEALELRARAAERLLQHTRNRVLRVLVR